MVEDEQLILCSMISSLAVGLVRGGIHQLFKLLGIIDLELDNPSLDK